MTLLDELCEATKRMRAAQREAAAEPWSRRARRAALEAEGDVDRLLDRLNAEQSAKPVRIGAPSSGWA